MLASLCVLLLNPPALGKRLVIHDSFEADVTNTTVVNLAEEGGRRVSYGSRRRRNRRRRRDRRRVSSTDKRGQGCSQFAYCRDNPDAELACPDCGQRPLTDANKYMWCCKEDGKYPRGHGCWGSPDSNRNTHTCSRSFCPDLNGVWTRWDSGRSTRHIRVQSWGCFLKFDVGNGQAADNFTWGTSTPHLLPPDYSAQAWLRLKGGYIWGEAWLWGDKGTINAGSAAASSNVAVVSVNWESGVHWIRGAHTYQCTVVLYQHDSFGGKESHTFDVGNYNKAAMKSRNAGSNDATSIKVGPGCMARIFDDDHFKGGLVVLWAGSHELKTLNFNDKVSSLKVCKSTVPASC